ncbi:hypothetical protein K505DRAFT_252562 [Melanomma pulvis-pyrius CBS 109.77]|uniref:WW domain-containing protein n=1 Tax=Melanomma pulvis-pyrius CBS 109.77 TaxID=1314802 RepID=A0A6A6WZX6_9PLEO|nr:hypothetical protein K505DRAFT_252562 [Melanomma pulvis-pyrius CBS 109.77]
MATNNTDKKPVGTAAEHAGPGAHQRPSPPVRQQSAESSDDGALSEAGEIAGSAIDSGGDAPPLPDEALPEDDGWSHGWDMAAQAWYFFNRFTGKRQWENPRVSEADATGYGTYDSNTAPGTTAYSGAPGTSSTAYSGAPGTSSPPRRLHGGYNPAIHGNYDPNADYALEAQKEEEAAEAAAAAATAAAAAAATAALINPQDYTTTAHFNRFTGRYQDPSVNPDNHNDANKSRRQMSAFFDVDAAANSHDGRSLKAERRSKTLSRQELAAYKNKRKAKKEEKRRAWLLD